MTVVILQGDARSLPLPDASVDLIVTSPPYFGLRSYTDGGGHYAGQIGSEATPAEYIGALVACTREWVRVLKPSGSLFVNLGDKYSSGAGPHTGKRPAALRSTRHGHGGGSKWTTTERQPAIDGFREKSLLGLPWRYALACTDQLGLILRRDIIWHKPNGLPESVTDRCRSSHEYVFHLVRSPRYYSAVDEIRESYAPGTAQRYAAGYNDRAIDGKRLGIGTKLGGDTYGENPLGKLPGSVWEIPSQPLTVPPSLGVDHFAAFPCELPRRCILGWSPPGICLKCGEGRRPVTEQDLIVTRGKACRSLRDLASGSQSAGTNWRSAGGVYGRYNVTTTGYACACAQPTAPIRPAVVFDPFAGTGTTLLVASVLGRHAIGTDLSADYCRLARWRTSDPAERARAAQVPKPPPVMDGQEPLFEMAP